MISCHSTFSSQQGRPLDWGKTPTDPRVEGLGSCGVTACWACCSLLPPPLQVARQVSSLCTPGLFGTLNEFVRPGGSSGDNPATGGRPGVPVLSASGPSGIGGGPPGTPAPGAFHLRWGSAFGSSPHVVLTAVPHKEQTGHCCPWGSPSTTRHFHLQPECASGRGPPPSPNSIKVALFGGFIFTLRGQQRRALSPFIRKTRAHEEALPLPPGSQQSPELGGAAARPGPPRCVKLRNAQHSWNFLLDPPPTTRV